MAPVQHGGLSQTVHASASAEVPASTRARNFRSPGRIAFSRPRAAAPLATDRDDECRLLLVGRPLRVALRANGRVRRALEVVWSTTSADPAFDHTVAERWPSTSSCRAIVQVVSDHEVRRTLALMRQPSDGPLTAQVANEVCRGMNANAVLDGTLSLVAAEYVLGLEALDCQTGNSPFRRQLKAARKEDVLAAIDTRGRTSGGSSASLATPFAGSMRVSTRC